MGLVEAIGAVPRALRALRTWEADIVRWRPDAVLTIDSPSLLLRLGRRLRGRVPVCHWVAPQVWAWRAGRARKVVRSCDLLCCLLPFEPSWFPEGGARVRFTGHPAARWDDQFDASGPVALFPGSRAAEVDTLWPVFRETAGRLCQTRPGLRFRVARAPTIDGARLGGLAAEIVDGERALDGASAALVCSGTASLQAAAAGIPQVVAYRVNPVSFAIARGLVALDHVCLPNLLAGRGVVPEHLQRLDPSRLADSLSRVLGPSGLRQREQLRRVLDQLEPAGALERVVDGLESMVGSPVAAR